MDFSIRMKASFIVFAGLMIILLSAFVAGAPPVGADPLFADIDTTWAKEHIVSLTGKNIIESDPTRLFRPNDPVTRAELAQMLANAFTLIPKQEVDFTDIDSHPNRRAILQLTRAGVDLGSIGQKFLPEESVSRAELVSVVVRVLAVGEIQSMASSPSFTDVGESHHSFDHIEIASYLTLIPPYIQGVFQPNLAATRGEAVAVVDEAVNLQFDSGFVETVDLPNRLVTIRTGIDQRDTILDEHTSVFRNGRPDVLASLIPGDHLRIVSDRFGAPKIFIADGVAPINIADVTPSSTVGKGILSPQDLKAIVSGDWTELQIRLMNRMKDELVERGVDPNEADALVERDWQNVRHFGQNRLAELIGAQMGLDEQLIRSIIEGNFDELQKYAEDQVLENVVGLLFDNANNS